MFNQISGIRMLYQILVIWTNIVYAQHGGEISVLHLLLLLLLYANSYILEVSTSFHFYSGLLLIYLLIYCWHGHFNLLVIC